MAEKNQMWTSVTRIATPIALAIILAACSSQPKTPDAIDITRLPTLSSQEYMLQADAIQGSNANDWLIMAAKAALAEKDSNQAVLILNRIGKQKLTEVQQAEWQLARALYLEMLNQTTQALQQLNFQNWWTLPESQWEMYHQTRARLYATSNEPINAAYELTKLSERMAIKDRAVLSEQIWGHLSDAARNDLANAMSSDTSREFSAWVQLSTYMKTLGDKVAQLKNALELWQQEHPGHTASFHTPQEVLSILQLDIVEPMKTALLLPLSGKYEKPASLVRDGFMMAMMDDSERASDATLTVIDTNKVSLDEFLNSLEAKEYDFIVGPLEKGKIEQLTALQETSTTKVPVLALNIPDVLDSTHNTCYLTLSPEQEVEQAATHLFDQGYQYPLILAPKGVMGERVAIAFQNEWSKYSRNKAVVSYFGTTSQLQQNINAVLGITESQGRIAQMENLLGLELEHQMRNRRDIDAVYIVASRAELTLIKPFIEVAINPEAKPPRLFANSSSNDGGKRQFEDLSGIQFSDIPMIIEIDPALQAKLDTFWPEQSNGQLRLQALGMDAYHLITQLPQMKVSPQYEVKGKTGLLSLNEQCVVERAISWSEHGAL